MTESKTDIKFSLVICTYSRADSVIRLMESVKRQTLYPFEILIIDSSEDEKTKIKLDEASYSSLSYYKVEGKDKGLTRQRNYGIKKVHRSSEIICFLDDDIVLEPEYFFQLIRTYKEKPEAVAVGGWIKEEISWKKVDENYQPAYNEFLIDGYVRTLGQRNVLRKRLGLLADKPPGYMPEFSHGFSTGFLPPSGKIYEVEYFMGGVSSYRKSLFNKIGFSSFFEGYGLYEDMDFCLRASKIGKLYVNTGAEVSHLHDLSGRPDYFKYGKMMIRNGWYVWRMRYPSPKFKAWLKWISINILLLVIRIFNGFRNTNAFADSAGRIYSLSVLIFKKPEQI